MKTEPAPEGEYDDQTKMSFGVYRKQPLQEVPASYLHYLWTRRPLSDPKLERYIQRNLHNLKKEHPDGIW